LKVAQMGHPVLRRVADPIDPTKISLPAVQQMCGDLLETMDEYDGAGLAAPQVHLSIRVVALTLDDDEGPEIWFNPVITPVTDELASMYEGCLSVAGLRGRVHRPVCVHVRYYDVTGTERAYVLQGFPAVVAQHECDHLDGVLYVDRVDTQTLAFLPEYRRYRGVTLDDEDESSDTDDDDVSNWGDAVIEVPPTLSPADAYATVSPNEEE